MKINKYLVLILILIFKSHSSFSQIPDSSITFDANYAGHFFQNFNGGITKGGTYLGQGNLCITFNTEKAGLWKGGEVYFNGMSLHGGEPSKEFVGDLQLSSNIEGGNHSSLFEFWYQQRIGKFSILLGQHDMSSEFNHSDNGILFINRSFSIIPSISSNFPASIFPHPGLGAIVKYDNHGKFIARAAVYDGDPGTFENDPYDIRWKLSKERGALAIGELVYYYIQNEPNLSKLSLGFYYHTAKFPHLTDSTRAIIGKAGLFMTVDQKICSQSAASKRGLGAFFQFGYSPEKSDFVDFYLSGGFNYFAPFRKRDNDILGIALSHCSINNDVMKYYGYLGHETTIELTYLAKINKHINVQPDFQYIIQPGADPGLKNAFIGIFAFYINF